MTRARPPGSRRGLQGAGLGAAARAGHLYQRAGPAHAPVHIHEGHVPTSATPPALGSGEGPGGSATRGAARVANLPVETPHLRAFGPGGSGRSARGREGSVAPGARGPAHREERPAPRALWAVSRGLHVRGVGAAAHRSGRSGAASAFQAACVGCGFAPGAGPLLLRCRQASASPGARGWRRGWRAGRRLLAPRRRPGPALLGTWKTFREPGWPQRRGKPRPRPAAAVESAGAREGAPASFSNLAEAEAGRSAG